MEINQKSVGILIDGRPLYSLQIFYKTDQDKISSFSFSIGHPM